MPEITGSSHVCPICFWEDDDLQLRWVNLPVGANAICLVEAQKNYAAIGVMENRFRQHVRGPNSDEGVDPLWRPVVPDIDKIFFASNDQIEAERNWGSDGKLVSRAVDHRVNRYWINGNKSAHD